MHLRIDGEHVSVSCERIVDLAHEIKAIDCVASSNRIKGFREVFEAL